MKIHSKRRILVLIWVVVVITAMKPILGIFKNTDTIINKIACRIYDYNTIDVTVHDQLELENISIKHGDKYVFNLGEKVNEIGSFYGKITFKVYHKDLLIAEVGHWRQNNWYSNDYQLDIYQNRHNFLLSLHIEGPDGNNKNFQNQYIYDEKYTLEKINFINENGEVYHVEKQDILQ